MISMKTGRTGTSSNFKGGEGRINFLPYYMFYRQLLEDYDFDDIVEVYEHDKYFMYLRKNYSGSLGDAEKLIFDQLKKSVEPNLRESLEVLTLRKEGLLPRIMVMDIEDELIGIRDMKRVTLAGHAGMPIDLVVSSDVEKGLRFIVVFLLEFTYFKEMDENERYRNDLRRLGGVEVSVEIDEFVSE